MSYEQLKDGGSYAVKSRSKHKFSCCDCGLVHTVSMVIGKGKESNLIGVAMSRDKRATAGRRRGKSIRDRIREMAKEFS